MLGDLGAQRHIQESFPEFGMSLIFGRLTTVDDCTHRRELYWMTAFGVPSVEGDNREPGSCGWQLPGFCAEGRQTWERLFPHRNPLVARKVELKFLSFSISGRNNATRSAVIDGCTPGTFTGVGNF